MGKTAAVNLALFYLKMKYFQCWWRFGSTQSWVCHDAYTKTALGRWHSASIYLQSIGYNWWLTTDWREWRAKKMPIRIHYIGNLYAHLFSTLVMGIDFGVFLLSPPRASACLRQVNRLYSQRILIVCLLSNHGRIDLIKWNFVDWIAND